MKKLILYIVLAGICSNLTGQLPALIDTTKEWYLAWNDEFDYPDSQLEEKWISQNGASWGVVLCSRWRENAIVKDSILELVARKESRGGQDWTAGSIWTKERFGYGYYECRYKYAGATGTNNSFWTWTRQNLEEGQKAFELDVNEGHYPNIVNTNIHYKSDKDEDGNWPQFTQRFALGGIVPQPAYTHVFDTPVTAGKIRFSSTHGAHFHIGEFRI